MTKLAPVALVLAALVLGCGPAEEPAPADDSASQSVAATAAEHAHDTPEPTPVAEAAPVVPVLEQELAYGEGAADVYEESDVTHVEILDGDGCLPSGHAAGAPKPSGRVGVVEEDAEANGQIWTVAQYRERKIGHPNCVRAAVPYFGEAASEAA